MTGIHPTALGPYTLEARIGTGGMSELYLARTADLDGPGRTCVVKRLLPERAEDPDRVALFLDEARINLLLDHPNIVSVFDVGRDGSDLFLAMDHVDGVDLRWLLNATRRAGARIPPAVALFITAELLRALEHAHGARDLGGGPLRLVHRDISPENVLLGHDGSVRLADFGAARTTVSRSQLEPTTTLGKLGYMAPEQLERRQATAASDLFAVGLLLFEMLALRALQRAESAQAAYEFWRCFEPTRVIPGTVPLGNGGALLVRALERDPFRRHRSAAAFLAEVDELRLRRGERSSATDLAALLDGLRGTDGMGEKVTTSPVDLGALRPVRERWPEPVPRSGEAVSWTGSQALQALGQLATRTGGWRVRVWLEGTSVELLVADGGLVDVRVRYAGEGRAVPRDDDGADPVREVLGEGLQRILVRRNHARRLALVLRWKHMWSTVTPAPELAGRGADGQPRLNDVLADVGGSPARR